MSKLYEIVASSFHVKKNKKIKIKKYKNKKLPDLSVRTSALNGLPYCRTVNLIVIKTQKVDTFFLWGKGRGGVRNATGICNFFFTWDLYRY
jgi:hypothetical protein